MISRYRNEVEYDCESAFVKGVKARRGMALKLTFIGVAGAPDRLVLLPGGRFHFVELKSPTGKLEVSQTVLFPKLEALGFHVTVLRGLAEVRDFFSKLDGEIL